MGVVYAGTHQHKGKVWPLLWTEEDKEESLRNGGTVEGGMFIVVGEFTDGPFKGHTTQSARTGYCEPWRR